MTRGTNTGWYLGEIDRAWTSWRQHSQIINGYAIAKRHVDPNWNPNSIHVPTVADEHRKGLPVRHSGDGTPYDINPELRRNPGFDCEAAGQGRWNPIGVGNDDIPNALGA